MHFAGIGTFVSPKVRGCKRRGCKQSFRIKVPPPAAQVAHKDHIDSSKRTILSMSELLNIVQGEQRYLQRKLNRHQTTVHSNNARTLFYTIMEVAALLAVSVVQILVIKRFFNGPTRLKLGV